MSAKFSEDLLSLGKELLIESDFHKQLCHALDQAVQVTGAERGALILISGNGDWIVEAVNKMDLMPFNLTDFHGCRQAICQSIGAGEVLFAPYAVQDLHLNFPGAREKFGEESIIFVPLIEHQNLFGLVYLEYRPVKNTFDRRTCIYLQKFAQLISLAALKACQNLHTDYLIDPVNGYRPNSGFETIIGYHPKILEILDIINQIADSDATVLIQGESGAGKELVARALHSKSKRRDKAFVPVNCGAIPEQLLESELFGHVRGAYTGAVSSSVGWFEKADGGTIFLDEVNDMSSALQIRLLRILQSGEYARVGSSKLCHCDVRVVAAASQDLKELVNKGLFRKEVFYRLNVIDLWVPPLRERACDIPLLIRHFLNVYGAQNGKQNLRLSKAADSLLLNYSFPGNVRELENIINRAVVLTKGSVIEVKHLSPAVQQEQLPSENTQELVAFKIAKQIAVEKFEREYIDSILQFTRGNISLAARHARIPFANFYAKMKKYGINPNFYKGGGDQANT